MLIGHEGRDHVQLAKRYHQIAKLRHNETKLPIQDSNRPSFEFVGIQNGARKAQILKLPQITSKPPKIVKMRQPQPKKQKQKKMLESNKIMELIHKQLSIQRKNYFQTISSERALIIKNTGRSQPNSITQNNEEREQKDRILWTERQQVMTPPLKVYQTGKIEGGNSLPKTKKKFIKNQYRQESYSPWNYQESEDNTLQQQFKKSSKAVYTQQIRGPKN